MAEEQTGAEAAPQQEPQAPPAPPPAAPPPAATVPEMPADTQFTIPMPDGRQEIVSLKSLVESHQNKPPPQDPAEQEKYATWQKAMAGDPAASRALIDAALPAEPAKELTDAEKQLEAMGQRLQQVEARAARGEQVAAQIDDARVAGGITRVIKEIGEGSDKLPYLSKLPNATALVQGVLRRYEEQARQKYGKSLVDLPGTPGMPAITLRGIMQGALDEVEAGLAQQAAHWGLKPPEPAPTPTEQIANDQKAAATSDRTPSRLQINPQGQMVDAAGNQIRQTAHGTFEKIPTQQVTEAGTGASPGVETAAVPTGPFGEDGAVARMKAKLGQGGFTE